jgi:hypothetical protein
MSLISSLNVSNSPKIQHNHLSNSGGFVENSDFEFYKITLPDGSSRTFSDFESFEKCFNAVDVYLKSLDYLQSLTLSPSRLSVAISEILGVSPSPILYCG